MSHIILTSGQLAAGKDIITDYLVGKLPGNWQKLAFAHNVKKIFCNTFGVTREFVEQWKRNSDCPPGFQKNVRQSLQFIGDGFRTIDYRIWVKLLEKELDTNPNNAVITDGRYINELKMVKSRGGLNILVWRPGHENQIENQSEQQLVAYRDQFIAAGHDGRVNHELFDFFIVNNSSVADLYKKLDELIIPHIRVLFNL